MADLLLLLNNTGGIDWSFSNGPLPQQTLFARASTAQNFNNSGILTQAASGVPRFDYNPATLQPAGLLIEGQRTNLVYPSILATWGAGGATITPNSGTSPDGSNTLISINDGTTTAIHNIYTANSFSVTAGQTYTLSVFVKAGTATILQLTGGATAFGTNAYANFNLNTGVITSNGSSIIASYISPAGQGIYRVSIVCSPITSTTSVVSLGLVNDNPTAARLPSYTGTNKTVYAWGAQAELGNSASSYISTSGSAVTRAADVLSFTAPNGINKLRYVFDDNSTQDVSVSPGAYTVPTNLTRAWIKRIYSF
jgi:hypothetical protein